MQSSNAMDVDTIERGVEPGKPDQRASADATSARLVAGKRGPIDQQRVETIEGQRPRRDGACRSSAGNDDVGVHRHHPNTFAGLTSGGAVTAGSIGAAPEAWAACPA